MIEARSALKILYMSVSWKKVKKVYCAKIVVAALFVGCARVTTVITGCGVWALMRLIDFVSTSLPWVPWSALLMLYSAEAGWCMPVNVTKSVPTGGLTPAGRSPGTRSAYFFLTCDSVLIN